MIIQGTLGRVIPQYIGEWSADETYQRLDVVMHEGSSFICYCDTDSPSKGDEPDTEAAATIWSCLARKGDDGNPAEDGLNTSLSNPSEAGQALLDSFAKADLSNVSLDSQTFNTISGFSRVIYQNEDLDTITASGGHSLDGSPINSPTGYENGTLQVVYGGGHTVLQILHSQDGALSSQRTGVYSGDPLVLTWGDWIPVTTDRIGAIDYFPFADAPYGYLVADGALVSKTTYALLYARIGDLFGQTTSDFALPDLRGLFIRGLDLDRGIDSNRVLGSYQDDEFKSHNHGIEIDHYEYSTGLVTSGGNDPHNSGNPTYHTDNTGGAETRPKNLALLPCIRWAYG